MWKISAILLSMAYVTFTNLKCEMIDRKYGKFTTCHIKAVNRTHKYLDVYAKLKPNIFPINELKIKLEPMRKDNGFKPFFMSMTVDFCKYMRNPNIANIIARELHKSFLYATNLNHTCPYNHDFIVEKHWTGNLETSISRYIPVPNGDYALFSTWIIANTSRARTKLYFRIFN
nr:uncharacterized protein LOC123002725 [Drosophila takahashii]